MRIFVTGWDGLLGSALVPLLREDHAVDGMGIEDGDICDREGLGRRLRAFGPEAVIHLAAMTAVDRCESEEDEAFRVNGEGSRVAAAEAERLDVPILAVSTDYVFDGARRDPYPEDAEPNPLGVYGRSKLAGEEAVKGASLRWAIVRSAWLYGEGRRNFVDTVAELLETRDRLDVVDDQIGSPTYALDLAWALKELVERGARGIVHVVNRGHASWFEVAREVAEILDLDPDRVRPASTAEVPRPAPRPPYSVLDATRAEREFGIRLRPWREALRSYLEASRVA